MIEELQRILPADTPIHACLIQNKRSAQDADYRKFGDLFASIDTSERLLEQAISTVSAAPASEEEEEAPAVLVCGSIFLLGELFPKLGLDAGSIWTGRRRVAGV